MEFGAGTINVTLTHTLDNTMYNLPLTLKTYVPASWKTVSVRQGPIMQKVDAQQDAAGTYILYQVTPNTSKAILQP